MGRLVGAVSGWFEIIVPDGRVPLRAGESHRLAAEARVEVVQPDAGVHVDDLTITHEEVFTVLR